MKPSTSKLMQDLLRAGGICGSVAAVGLTLSGDALAGISNTKHNLSANQPATPNAVRSNGPEICAFCHTPHASNTNVLGAPLWNKGVPASTTFTTYTSGTLDGAITLAGAASLACLSCHDGAGAMDNMVNAPGSAGVTTGVSAGYTFTGASGGNLIPAANVTNLGKDLRNDHPIAILYAGGGYTATTGVTGGIKGTCVTCVDKDFWEPTRLAADNNGWYVDVATAGRQKTDIILYTNGGTTVQVECASCHDPHVETKATNQVAFLRISQAGSALCLACHNK